MGVIDRLSDVIGRVAAGLFFATGAMITFEVVARYFFNAPTIWAAEISQLFLLWGTFLGMARPLHHNAHIRITVLTGLLKPGHRRYTDMFALVFIAVFAAVVIWYGTEIALDSFVRGRSAGTMLDIPNWWGEAVIPLGFSLLLAQCIVELIRLTKQDAPMPDGQEHS